MSELVLYSEELIAWNDTTSRNWKKLIAEHPEALQFPCDVMGVKTVGELLQHIVAVELRYAEQLSGLPPTEYAQIPFDSADALYATHDRALAMYRQLLASGVDWDEQIHYVTRSLGPARSKRKSIFIHAMMHSIRHYAQLATLVRQHGIKPGWSMDYIMMDIQQT